MAGDTSPNPEFSLADQADLRRVARALADAARVATLAHFRSAGLMAESKRPEDFDPVTAADREAEAAMRAVLAEMRPDDGILGEEEAAKPSRSGLTWVLDPIDGTRGFIAGTPTWGVLIALEAGDAPVFGIIDQPYIGERFEGGFGQAMMVGPQGSGALAARGGVALSDAVLFTTFPEIGTEAERLAFERVRDQVRLTRYGMDCYAYALLASGQIDLVIEAGLQAYDIAAPIAVIEAAGGIVTNWQGGPAYPGGQVIAAGSPALHAAALALLADQVA